MRGIFCAAARRCDPTGQPDPSGEWLFFRFIALCQQDDNRAGPSATGEGRGKVLSGQGWRHGIGTAVVSLGL